MRRYTPWLLAGLCVLFVILATLLYTMRSAGQVHDDKFVPVTKTLTVYTTIPPEMASLIADEYRRENNVQINFLPVNLSQMEQHIASGDLDNADMVLTDSELLQMMAEKNQLSASMSEQQDIVGSDFKAADNKWIGVWYDPIVFCYNVDYVKNNWYIPLTWHDLSGQMGINIAMTDFMAASAAVNILYAAGETLGLNEAISTMKQLHPKVVRYAKYLSTPVRMAGMGEADVAVGVQSEALRYIHDNYPLTIIYPKDGTAYQLTAAGIVQGSQQREDADAFMQWLLGDEVQRVLQNSRYYYVPTNYSSLAYKEFAGKNIVFWQRSMPLDENGRRALLDEWVKQVRLTDED